MQDVHNHHKQFERAENFQTHQNGSKQPRTHEQGKLTQTGLHMDEKAWNRWVEGITE